MPFLSGGYHLSLPAKIAITNASFLAMMWELTDDDQTSAGEALENLGAIAQFSGTVYVLWVPPVFKASIAARVGVFLAPVAVPAAVVTSAVIVGGVVSYAIDPEEGLKNYKEFITKPQKILSDPEKTESLMQAHRIMQAGITLGGSELARAGIEVLGNFSEELFKNRYLTGPYLPF